MTYSSVVVSVENEVGQLLLSRPQKGNAINREMWTELPTALQELVAKGARAVN